MERIDKLLLLMIGIMLGMSILLGVGQCLSTLCINQWSDGVVYDSDVVIGELDEYLVYNDDSEFAWEPELACDCIEFIEGDEGDIVTGTLCRCEGGNTSMGVVWVFEGKPAGLSDLYHYMDEAMSLYSSQP